MNAEMPLLPVSGLSLVHSCLLILRTFVTPTLLARVGPAADLRLALFEALLLRPRPNISSANFCFSRRPWPRISFANFSCSLRCRPGETLAGGIRAQNSKCLPA